MADLAVVTGAGSGIGRAMAHALAERGLEVLVVGRRKGPLEETCGGVAGGLRPVAADVADPAGRARVVEATAGAPVRCLIHNAGVLEPIGPLAQVALEEWRHAQAVNVEGPLFLTQLLLGQLAGGRVLHVSSGAAHAPYAGWGSYCTTKAALHMLYRLLRDELGERDIAVGSLRPGVVDTPMQALIRRQPPERFPAVQRFLELHAGGRLERPEEVAAFTAWLLLDVPAAEFSADEWSFTDPAQRRRWEARA